MAWRLPLRLSLFGKSFFALYLAVAVPLAASGVAEAWLGYRAQRNQLDQVLTVEARLAATKITTFVDEITSQLAWLVRLPWPEERDERRRVDALLLLRQVPAIASLTLVDGHGRERIHVSRTELNRTEARTDLLLTPAVLGARARRTWFSPIAYLRGSEPHLTVALAGDRPSSGVVIAQVNLKLIWDVISGIKVGRTGLAFVLDEPGRLVAHPDISLVLRGADDATLRPFQEIRTAVLAAGNRVATVEDGQGTPVAAAAAPIGGVGWTVIVEQPLAEAFRPIYAALWRTAAILLGGTLLAALLAYWLARRLTGPIRVLQQGTEHIGTGRLDHRIDLRTGDELQRLAESFNAMAAGLEESREREERIAKLRRFLAPQVAELIDRAGGDELLEGRRAEIVALFGDLRGFTAFSAKATPEDLMRVLSEYHTAVGRIVTEHGATLASYMGDGVMILVNAPVASPDPALLALDLAADLQGAIQDLVGEWRRRGNDIGFGVGLALGPAIVGRIGYEGRYDYAAIGCVTNLAARLCAQACDGEILVDPAAAEAAQGCRPLGFVGCRTMKGYDRDIPVFRLETASTRHVA